METPTFERTLVLIKPDAIQRELAGEIIIRIERKGLQLVGLKMLMLNDSLMREHYAHLTQQPFFEEIAVFMKSTPIIAVCVQGLEAVSVVRATVGITLARKADTGTIRGDLAMSIQCNLVHASDSSESAKREITRFFAESELFDYERLTAPVIYARKEMH